MKQTATDSRARQLPVSRFNNCPWTARARTIQL